MICLHYRLIRFYYDSIAQASLIGYHRKCQKPRTNFVSFNEISEDNVAKCIQRLNNSLWKKQTIKVQQAQESFLSRLQKEREEAAKPKKIEQTFEPKNAIQHSSAL